MATQSRWRVMIHEVRPSGITCGKIGASRRRRASQRVRVGVELG